MVVVSLGSVTVDRAFDVDDPDAFADRFVPSPDPGETVTVREVPDLPAPDRTNVGGTGANGAVAAARAGAESALVCALGRDDDGERAADRLRECGVDVEGEGFVYRPVGPGAPPTGKAFVVSGADGESRVARLPGANEALAANVAASVLDRVRAADVLLLGNEVPVGTTDVVLSALDGDPDRPTVVFDPAPAEGAGALLDHEAVDYVTPNETEYDALRDALADFGGRVVCTLGDDGVRVLGEDGFEVVPPTVDAVDATAAGDTFAGYLAAGLAAGDGLHGATRRATAAGALATTERGTLSAVPDAEAVADLLPAE